MKATELTRWRDRLTAAGFLVGAGRRFTAVDLSASEAVLDDRAELLACVAELERIVERIGAELEDTGTK